MPTKQKGFTAVEAILIIVVVGIIGFAGWFVWNSQKQTDKTLNDASKGSSSIVATKKSDTVATNSSTASTAQTDTTNYLVVKEWDVKFALPNQIKSVNYQYDTSQALFPGNAILITEITDASGKQYTSAASTVDYNAQSVDAICRTRGLARSTKQGEVNATTGSAYEQVAHLGGYYYYIAHSSGGSCAESDSATAAINAVMNMFGKPVAQ
jgi:cytoskeletal protein RodZ